jgi:hypothetical protein
MIVKSMIIPRRVFFMILFVAVVVPWCVPKMIWIAGSAKTTGIMEFVGHGDLGSALGMSTYPVIKFEVGDRIFHFNGSRNVPLKKGEKVDVLFQKDNPGDAMINSFATIWGQTIAYAMGPLLVYLVLLVSPGVIPWRARLKIGWPSIVQVVD